MFIAKNLTVGWTSESPLFTAEEIHLPPGALVVLLGRNGSGKTCLLHTLAGLTSAFNTDGSRHSYQADFQNIALLPQPLHLVEHLTGAEFSAILNVSPTGELASYKAHNRHLSSVSSGEAQQYFVATTLLRQSKIFFLDEPFTNVDHIETCALVQKINFARDEGKSFVISIHEPSHLLLLKGATIWAVDDKKLLSYPNAKALFADAGPKTRLFPWMEWTEDSEQTFLCRKS
jgi:ABC-type Mn2+/Zn2+ transport system ATPase subunit